MNNAVAASHQMRDLVMSVRGRLQDALRNKELAFEPFMAAAVADTLREPKLLEAIGAAPETVIEALSVCANAGLLPGAAHDQFYLIPRYTKKRGRWECGFIIGYKGLTHMGYRNPRVHSIEAFTVHEGEEFEYDRASGKVHHPHKFGLERTWDNLIGAYSLVHLTVSSDRTTEVAGRPLVWPLDRSEIESRRNASDAYRREAAVLAKTPGARVYGPWFLWPLAMARKTVLRSHLGGGSIPRSTELDVALHEEDQHERIVDTEAVEIASEQTNAPKGTLAMLKAETGTQGRGDRLWAEIQANIPDEEAQVAALREQAAKILGDLPGLGGMPPELVVQAVNQK